MSYKQAFNQYSDSFFVDGWQEDAELSPIELKTILSPFNILYPKTDIDCDIEATKKILEDVDLPGYYFEVSADVTELDSSLRAFQFFVDSGLKTSAVPDNCAAFAWNN